MNLRFCFISVMAIMLSFCPFASASEDSPSPFPDDMYISDLPDLPDLSEFPELTTDAETNTEGAPSITLSTPINIPPENIEMANETVASEKNISDNNVNIPLSEMPDDKDKTENNESDTPKPIFLPNKQNTSEKQPSAINTNKSLTETLKNDKKGNIIEGTWIEKLTSMNPLSSTDKNNIQTKEDIAEDDLIALVKKSRGKNKNGKSNASVFDISGVMLRMKLNQVEKILKNRGFQKINAKFTIPNFIKWRNEEACSSQGIVGFERVQSCINTMAKKDGYEYVYFLKYAKFDSKEEIEVYLTSNFTENKVYKIIYRSKIPAIPGNSQKAIYMRNLKVYDFWKKINQKYGEPDNKSNVTWGLGGNKPFLKAATGYLLLKDPMFVEMDYTRMSREDQRFVHSDFYNF